jgi:hypothetical protein
VASANQIAATVDAVAQAENWNQRVTLIRAVPEHFGKAHHQRVYAEIANAVYVSELAPDFAYVHWREDYELSVIQEAYREAYALTRAFENVAIADLAQAIQAKPVTLRIFRLFLGFTTQELAAASSIIAASVGSRPLSNSAIKAMEGGRSATTKAAEVAARVVDGAMRGELFPQAPAGLRRKTEKPDTVAGWDTVRRYASENVPFPVFLHQRHYGGAFRQLLDATSGQRGNLLEQAVEDLFASRRILFVRTGTSTAGTIAARFGLTVRPAPDFAVHDASGSLRAILECKQANDGGTARDKASRFASLRTEAARLGGIPVFAVLAGLGWRRTADALGPVVRDTDGRVFTLKTLDAMIAVDPFPTLIEGS